MVTSLESNTFFHDLVLTNLNWDDHNCESSPKESLSRFQFNPCFDNVSAIIAETFHSVVPEDDMARINSILRHFPEEGQDYMLLVGIAVSSLCNLLEYDIKICYEDLATIVFGANYTERQVKRIRLFMQRQLVPLISFIYAKPIYEVINKHIQQLELKKSQLKN